MAKVRLEGGSAAKVLDGELRLLGSWEAAGPRHATELPVTAQLLAQGPILSLSAASLLAPVDERSKIICLGLNYRAHVEEAAARVAAHPGLFTRFADTLVGSGEPLVRPRVSSAYDYEGEIAVVMGRAGRHIPRERAMEHIFGFTIMLDGSVRDYQQHSVSAGKNFWRSGALGPWIVTADEIPDPRVLKLETRLNGETVQSTTADLMICDVPTAIEYISGFTPLSPGDVIAMGTPGGVGAMRKPPLWMRAGDLIEVSVSGIGTLTNTVHDEM